MQIVPPADFVVFHNLKHQIVCDTLQYKNSAVAEMGDRGHNRHGPKRGGCCAPFAGGAAGSPSSTVAWAKAYLHTKWHLDAISCLATIDMGRKLGALSFFWGG